MILPISHHFSNDFINDTQNDDYRCINNRSRNSITLIWRLITLVLICLDLSALIPNEAYNHYRYTDAHYRNFSENSAHIREGCVLLLYFVILSVDNVVCFELRPLYIILQGCLTGVPHMCNFILPSLPDLHKDG